MLHYPLDPNVAIHEACWVGQASVLRLLLEARAEVNLANSGGQTPLHLASMKGHRDLVQLLLGIAADVSLVDMRGKTAVQLAGDANFSDIDARYQSLESAHLDFVLSFILWCVCVCGDTEVRLFEQGAAPRPRTHAADPRGCRPR